jgi:hypothetical protein
MCVCVCVRVRVRVRVCACVRALLQCPPATGASWTAWGAATTSTSAPSCASAPWSTCCRQKRRSQPCGRPPGRRLWQQRAQRWACPPGAWLRAPARVREPRPLRGRGSRLRWRTCLWWRHRWRRPPAGRCRCVGPLHPVGRRAGRGPACCAFACVPGAGRCQQGARCMARCARHGACAPVREAVGALCAVGAFVCGWSRPVWRRFPRCWRTWLGTGRTLPGWALSPTTLRCTSTTTRCTSIACPLCSPRLTVCSP